MSLSQIALNFISKIEQKDAIIGIIGMGYVGIPLAHAFVEKGHKVLGFDVIEERVAGLSRGESYIKHFSNAKMKGMVDSGLFSVTADMSRMAEADALLICVPTPLNTYREPDLTYVEATVHTIAKTLRPGQLVVLESTTWPGTSDEVIRPILEAGGLSSKTDFGIAYSPEREDPGNKNFDTGTIPKVVGADSADAAAMAEALYSVAVTQVVPVRDTRTAEAVKLTENIYRLVNIAMVNELKSIYSDMDIDVWEVIDAAKTKPFGFQAFYPGPGLGGHCIPIDPFYLTWKARAFGRPTRFIELAGEINDRQPQAVVDGLMAALNQKLQKALSGSKILLMGVSYKENIDDMRESPSFLVWELLKENGAEVVYHDPFIPTIPLMHEHPEFAGEQSVDLTPELLASVDAAIITTNHSGVDYDALVAGVPIALDTRNALHALAEKYPKKIFKA